VDLKHHPWRLWMPLLLTPLLALAAQFVAYALAGPLCAHQAGQWIHAVFIVAVLAAALLLHMAWRELRRLVQAHGGALPLDTDRHAPQRLFLAQAAFGSAALSLLALLAMWIPQAVLSPCHA
jgi:hypothetical protein